MKKISIFFIVILISFLSACSNDISDDEKKNLYTDYFMELEERDLYQRRTIEVFHEDTYIFTSSLAQLQTSFISMRKQVVFSSMRL